MLKLLNFDIIIDQASGRYNALSETTQNDLKESLSNGKALLKVHINWTRICIIMAIFIARNY